MNRISKLNEYLTATPDDAFLQHALALEHVKIGDDHAARQLFESILLREPQYVGSYYHLAKLLERAGDKQAAIQWYEKGMRAAQQVQDRHAFNELQMARDELLED